MCCLSRVALCVAHTVVLRSGPVDGVPRHILRRSTGTLSKKKRGKKLTSRRKRRSCHYDEEWGAWGSKGRRDKLKMNALLCGFLSCLFVTAVRTSPNTSCLNLHRRNRLEAVVARSRTANENRLTFEVVSAVWKRKTEHHLDPKQTSVSTEALLDVCS